MIRKSILFAVVAAATLTGLTATPSRAAADPLLFPHHRFEVGVARGSEWESHGVYRIQAEAELVAIRLRHHGYRVEIRQF